MALEIERGFHGGVPYIAIKGLKKTKDNEELATTLVKELIPEMFEKVTLNNWVNDETLEIRYPIDDDQYDLVLKGIESDKESPSDHVERSLLY